MFMNLPRKFRFFLFALPYFFGLFIFSGHVRAENYQWLINEYPNRYWGNSPLESFNNWHNAKWPGWTLEITQQAFTSETTYRVTFNNRAPGASTWTNTGIFVTVTRVGDSCASGKEYNASTGACEEPISCEFGKTQLIASSASCTNALCSKPRTVCVQSCEYITSPSAQYPGKCYPNYDNPTDSYCFSRYISSGDECAPGTEDISETAAADVPENPTLDDPDPCVTFGVHTFCQDKDQPNCGTLDGQPYCNTESDKCGTVNGEFICIPKSDGRNCSYVNGSYECITADGSKIPHDSSDHPDNGGNADGQENNDAQAPGTVVVGAGGGQGTNDPATNKAIRDLQASLGDRLDGIADLLEGEGGSLGNTIQEPTQKGTFDLDEWDSQINQGKQTLDQRMSQMRAEFAQLGDVSLGGGGSLPCFGGDDFRLCFSEYSDLLSPLRFVIIFLATVLAFYIVFVRD